LFFFVNNIGCYCLIASAAGRCARSTLDVPEGASERLSLFLFGNEPIILASAEKTPELVP